MNGIIHSWAYEESSPIKRDEKQVFSLILNNIEVLFDKLRPLKSIFIAVDGVAPQIKMAQQRSRRFQSATAFKKMLAQNKLSREDCFDSVNISPGTEFMERLHLALIAFIHRKRKMDPIWSHIEVRYSGHDAPGEGEHKIREYLASRRTEEGYIQKERHCFYGMDADLIFLALTTHEENICILRENVLKISGSSPFYLPRCIIYISVLRDYIDLEFEELKSLKFYDREKLIDDWVFLGFLLGNDFLPNLPNMMIHADTLEILWDTYKVVLPQLDGFLCEGSIINFERLTLFLEELSKFDKEWFRDNDMGNKWIESKRAEKLADDLENLGTGALDKKRHGSENSDDFDYTKEEFEDDQIEFNMFIRDYYSRKFNFDVTSTPLDQIHPDVHQVIYHFCKTLQWIMCYYFSVVPDWDYYYPYHYSPFTTDIARLLKSHFIAKESCDICPPIKKVEKTDKDHMCADWIHFNFSAEPIKPFQLQILIFPETSASLMPLQLRHLVSSDPALNPLAKYFPEEYEVDQNDKKADYEAVVLIPFMNRSIIMPHYKEAIKNVSSNDLERNRHGYVYLFFKSNDNGSDNVTKYPEDYYRRRVQWNKGLPQSSNLPAYHGFDCPRLTTKEFTHFISNQKIKLFENWNTTNVMNLKIKIDPDILGQLVEDEKKFAELFLGHPQRIRWPHFITVMPVRIVCNSIVYQLKNFNQSVILDPSKPASIEMYELTDEHKVESEWINDYRNKMLELIKTHRGITIAPANEKKFTSSLVFCRKIGSWSVKSRNVAGKVTFSMKPEFRAYNLIENLDTSLPSGYMSRATDQGDKYVKRSMFDTDFGSVNSNVYIDFLEMVKSLPKRQSDVLIPLPTCVADKEDQFYMGMPLPLSKIFFVRQKVISFHKENFGSPMEVISIDADKGFLIVKSPKYEKYKKFVDLSFLKRQASLEMNEKYYSVYDIFQMLRISRSTIGKMSNLFFVEITETDKNQIKSTEFFVNNKPQKEISKKEEEKSTEEKAKSDSDHDEEYVPLMKANLSSRNAMEKKSQNKRAAKKNLINIGLKLRDKRNWDTIGWSRYQKEKWYFSHRFIDFLRKLQSSFPALLDRVDKCDDKYLRDIDLFPKETNLYMTKLLDFIKTFGPKDLEKKSPEVETVPESFQRQIMVSLVNNFNEEKMSPTQNFWKVSPVNVISSMFNGFTLNAKLMSTLQIELFSRVVNLKSCSMVPFGLTGTVVTLYKESNSIKMIEVLFDETFEGAKEVKNIGPYFFNVSIESVVPLPSDSEISKLNLKKLEPVSSDEIDLSKFLNTPPKEWLVKTDCVIDNSLKM